MEEATVDYSSQMREESGLTQRELAELAGVAHTYLSRIENRKKVPSRALDALLCSLCATSRLNKEQSLTSAKCLNRSGADPSLAQRVAVLEADVSQIKTWLLQLLASNSGERE